MYVTLMVTRSKTEVQKNPLMLEATQKIEKLNPLQTATGVYITVHGHFYQPPRENPYLNTIERQPSAYPFHDWNERIHHECYRPNAFARILNQHNEVVGIVNNYEYMSFNIGPTLMSWLENHDSEVYHKIVEADRLSCERLNGHGNAIAQVYNHIILPLANKRDKYTQVRWGKLDFEKRFGRKPEGMWLAETAVDMATLEVLVDEGIRFIILAPSQAQRICPIPTKEKPEPEWLEVGGAQIDPTRPYRCYVDNERFIDIFFYDGPISRDMGFGDVLWSTNHLVNRLNQAVRGDFSPYQLISVATDGETFGHHKKETEKCLAYAFTYEFGKKGWTVTNYAHYLSIHEPTWEVQIKPLTAWSCAHGVDRWQEDCGCGGGGSWHQKWRQPLRQALDWLRDKLVEVYDGYGSKYFNNPWQARDEYITVVLDRTEEKVEQFLTRQQHHPLTRIEQIDALRLLEMQRHTLLMYTSCGWFFEEISRPEGVQILRYAARALELAGDVTGTDLSGDFIHLLSNAPSNVPEFGDGAQVYKKLVITSQITFKQVAAHYAISSLFTTYNRDDQVYCYKAHQLDYVKQQMGPLTLVIGQVLLSSTITWESHHFVFVLLHLGGWDFCCCIQPFTGRTAYTQVKTQLLELLKDASAAKLIGVMHQVLGHQFFDLQHLFAQERHDILQKLTESTKKRLDQLYTQVYRDNYGILMAFQRDELPTPVELQVAAEIALSFQVSSIITELERTIGEPQQMNYHLTELAGVATEANSLRCNLKIPDGKKTLERLILVYLQRLLKYGNPSVLEIDAEVIIRLISVATQLHLDLCLARAQELYYSYLHKYIIPQCLNYQGNPEKCRWLSYQLPPLLGLGQKLGVDISTHLGAPL